MGHPLAVDGENGLHTWMISADALNKQMLTADKEWSSNLKWWTNSHHYYKISCKALDLGIFHLAQDKQQRKNIVYEAWQPEGKRPHGRPRYRWQVIFMHYEEQCIDVEWFIWPLSSTCKHDHKPFNPRENRKFVDHLTNSWFGRTFLHAVNFQDVTSECMCVLHSHSRYTRLSNKIINQVNVTSGWDKDFLRAPICHSKQAETVIRCDPI